MLKVHNLHNARLMMHSRKALQGNELRAELVRELDREKTVKVHIHVMNGERIRMARQLGAVAGAGPRIEVAKLYYL